MFMVASSVVSTILILNYHHRNANTHEMSDWVSSYAKLKYLVGIGVFILVSCSCRCNIKFLRVATWVIRLPLLWGESFISLLCAATRWIVKWFSIPLETFQQTLTLEMFERKSLREFRCSNHCELLRSNSNASEFHWWLWVCEWVNEASCKLKFLNI